MNSSPWERKRGSSGCRSSMSSSDNSPPVLSKSLEALEAFMPRFAEVSEIMSFTERWGRRLRA